MYATTAPLVNGFLSDRGAKVYLTRETGQLIRLSDLRQDMGWAHASWRRTRSQAVGGNDRLGGACQTAREGHSSARDRGGHCQSHHDPGLEARRQDTVGKGIDESIRRR